MNSYFCVLVFVSLHLEVEGLNEILGVFLVSAKNAFVPVKHDNSVNIYSRISTVPRGSERSEWVSPWMERAREWSEQSERSEAELGGVSEKSEWCERTNVASDRVALSKRDCLWIETCSYLGIRVKVEVRICSSYILTLGHLFVQSLDVRSRPLVELNCMFFLVWSNLGNKSI